MTLHVQVAQRLLRGCGRARPQLPQPIGAWCLTLGDWLATGWLVTTTRIGAATTSFAADVGGRIKLIDGNMLTGLIKEHLPPQAGHEIRSRMITVRELSGRSGST